MFSVFLDENQNGLKEDDEKVISSQNICNGVSSFSTLFSMNRVNTGLSACASGSGVQLNSGLDVNRSASLEASEILQVEMLCDGANGASGANGSNGTNGHSLVFKTTPASVDLCANGGTTLLMALDTNDTGLYSLNLPNQQAMTLCNGVNAEIPAYAAVDSIQPCGNTVAYKEVLLRLQSGQVLGSFSNDVGGTMTRLAFLPDGTYMNTDDSACQFSLATNAGTRSISWFGQVQKTWQMLGL